MFITNWVTKLDKIFFIILSGVNSTFLEEIL